MNDLDTMYTDATCYESETTDPKLLSEGIEKAYVIMCALSAKLNLHRPRTKYLDVEKANLSYRKQRRHTQVQTRKLTRRLLNLLGKILKERRRMERENAGMEELLTSRQKSDIEIITRMYRQKKNHFENDDPRESVKDRIVSISKPYVRPIVRGKEVKSVEFGAKCNNILVDGLSFIEKLAFNAFNEGTSAALPEDAPGALRCGCEESRCRCRLCRQHQQGILQGERDTEFVHEAGAVRPS